METITRACQAENLDIKGYCGQRRTDAHSVVAVRLLEEAVDLPHLAERRLRPAMFRDDRLNLRPERLDPFRMPGEVIQDVHDALHGVRG